MRAKTILHLCCVFTLMLPGAAWAAETAPALTISAFDEVAPICTDVPAPRNAQQDLGDGPVPEAACPPSVWQACYQRYGTCALCFCIGSSCECENRCV